MTLRENIDIINLLERLESTGKKSDKNYWKRPIKTTGKEKYIFLKIWLERNYFINYK